MNVELTVHVIPGKLQINKMEQVLQAHLDLQSLPESLHDRHNIELKLWGIIWKGKWFSEKYYGAKMEFLLQAENFQQLQAHTNTEITFKLVVMINP